MRLEPREASSLLLGRGSFLPSATCRAIVDEVMARAWWQRSEIGEAGASSVDVDTCNSLWCWLEGRYRQLVMTRLAVLAKAMGSLPGRPRLEEPIVLRYDRGGLFRRHNDEYERADHTRGRRMSLVVFLTSQDEPGGHEGGELCFYVDDGRGETSIRFPGRAGEFVVFAARVDHEVLPVRRGPRLTLVSWLY